MSILKSQKTIDWGLIIIINFMWATQVPVIRFIGDRLGPITVAFIPDDRQYIDFSSFSMGRK